MKRFFTFSLAIYIFALSIFSASFRSEAVTSSRPSFAEWFNEVYESDGTLLPLEDIPSMALSMFLYLATGILFPPDMVDNFVEIINGDLISLPEGEEDFDSFIEDNTTLNSSDKFVSITGQGRRKLREAVDLTITNYSDIYYYKSNALSNNLLYFNSNGSGPVIDSSNLDYMISFFNDFQDDYYILAASYPVSSSTNYQSFFNNNFFVLVPKNNALCDISFDSSSLYSFNDGSQNINFTRMKVYSKSSSTQNNIYYITSNNIISAYSQGTPLTLLNKYNNDFFVVPFNSSYGVLSLPKLFNNNNFPYLNVSSSIYASSQYNYSNGWIFLTLNDVEIMTIYRTYNIYLASSLYVPNYFVGDTYYNYDYSSDNSSTIGTQNIYNNSPTYNDVANYYNEYIDSHDSAPSSTIVYNYINNYYDSSGSNGSGGSTSGGDSGGSGGSGGGIFDWLGSLGSVLGSLISGFGNLIVNLLDSVVDVFGNLATVLPESMGTFFSTFFEWLPPEWVSLITLSLTLGIVFGLVRLVRG